MANRVSTRAAKDLAGEVIEELPELKGGELDMEVELSKLTDAVKAAIEAGDVITRKNEVTRKVKEKKYRKEYLQLVPINFKGMVALGGGVETTWAKNEKDEDFDFQGPCVVKDFFYGNDLGAKSKQSQALAILVEGPDNAKIAAAKNLAKAFGISFDDAMAKVNAMQP